MQKEELLSVLRLQKTKNIGDILAKKLISVVGSADEIFRQKKTTLQKINGIGTFAIKHLFDAECKKLAEQEYEYIVNNNISFSYFLDNDYPKYLQQCIDAPILLFKDGKFDLTNPRIISVVGTRNSTNYGRGFIKSLISDLKDYNPIIVSGFAYGCDIEAHKEAIKNNLQTIAILAHGFDQIYPKTHKKYIHQVNENGGFFTEFWHDEDPLRENFLKRNRIVAGISQATIVIESAEKGGSLVTADIANSYNREVFALSGKATDMYSRGCNNLIKNNQAQLLTSAKDIVEMLNWDVSPKIIATKQAKLFVDLNKTEQKIYDYLKENGKQLLDVIALECAIPTYQLSSILITMELKGVVKPLPGKLFEI